MNNPLDLPEDLCRSFRVDCDPDSDDAWLISTPFSYDDGDAYPIWIIGSGSSLFVTDRGQALDHLGEDWNLTDARRGTIERLAEAAGARLDGETLTMGKATGSLIWTVVEFIRLLSQIDGLDDQEESREQAEQFVTTVRNRIRRAVPYGVGDRWYSPNDTEKRFHADLSIDLPGKPPLLAFTVSTPQSAWATAYTETRFRKWDIPSPRIAFTLGRGTTTSSRDVYAVQDALGPDHVHELPQTDAAIRNLIDQFT